MSCLQKPTLVRPELFELVFEDGVVLARGGFLVQDEDLRDVIVVHLALLASSIIDEMSQCLPSP